MKRKYGFSTGISIHAPSRERLDDIKPYIDTVEFQSTLPRGSDGLRVQQTHRHRAFQSTLPRGSDANYQEIEHR